MAVTPVIQLADIKAYLGVSGSTSDAVLTPLVAQIQSVIEGYVNRLLSEQTITEYRDGRGQVRLKLANWPLVSVASVVVDGVTIPIFSNSSTSGYWAPVGGRDVVLRGQYIFSEGLRNVVLTYTAGFGGVNAWPADIQLAALESVAAAYKARTRQGVSSKTLATESVAYVDQGANAAGRSLPLVASACAKLNNYKNVVPDL